MAASDQRFLFFSPGIIKNAIDQAILLGIPSHFLAYLLILPILASLIAAARHILGLATYGTFIPAVIALIWAESGLGLGLFLFLFLIFWGAANRQLIKKISQKGFRINYLPRMSILLLVLSCGILFLALVPTFGWVFKEPTAISSLLILILVIHNLIESQVTLSSREAQTMFWETALFSLVGFFLFRWNFLNLLVLAHPGLTLLLILTFNIFVGRYLGFRLLEYYRFKSIINKN